jgi:hypothetical protein
MLKKTELALIAPPPAPVVKAEKPVSALAAKKEVAPKAPLINSVFNLARQS